jgi:hypothetical protein
MTNEFKYESCADIRCTPFEMDNKRKVRRSSKRSASDCCTVGTGSNPNPANQWKSLNCGYGSTFSL